MDEADFDITETRWEWDAQAYQVRFWTQLNNPDPPLVPLWEVVTHRLVGVRDIHEVLEWARENAAGRHVAVYAEVDRPGETPGAVRLVGVDPTQGERWP